MSAVAIIPAKGTSRRVPGKNRKMFHGHPIINYSIKAAKNSGLFGRIIVSTDDDWIGRYSEGCGAYWYARKEELALDNVGTQVVAADVLRWLHTDGDDPYQFACVIYPTAPMLLPQDLMEGFSKLLGTPHEYHFIPGWFYWGTSRAFMDDVPLGSTWSPSSYHRLVGRYIDINTEEDFEMAEKMYAERFA